ncbi:MAG: ATP-binding protein [Deltaproteobacteria bacterium]|nr:ATP-binding protein [Deltaproteobacteria bacterium]
MRKYPSTTRPKTLPLTVDNTGFLLDRLGEDCHPFQFLRELTQNAIEAIQRTPEKRGEIVWDVDWISYELEGGPFKLSITDTGDGMTGEEMEEYINKLSSSETIQSVTGRYGVGAKIAAATRNHAGLIYLSWKDGEGSMIHLWRDPQNDQYGLRQFERPGETFGHYVAVEDAVKPEMIGEHGTKIILLGNDEAVDTMAAPEGAPSPSIWVAKYLNSRYFKLPENITVKARQGWTNPRSDSDRNILRTILGQYEYLQQHAESSGTVELTNATAYWWILKDENALTTNSGFIESSGHVAALYQNELYEVARGRAATPKLQQFGVVFGSQRVVIYVEPKEGDGIRLTTNTARTHLSINNLPLPWAEWTAEFREQMPTEIDDLIQEVAAGAKSSDHSQSIRERLKDVLDLFRVSRYRPIRDGDTLIDPGTRTRGGLPRERDQTTTTDGTGPSGTQGGTAGGTYAMFLKKEGVPGKRIRPDVFPLINWVSVKEGTRTSGDLEDRAARFLGEQNKLLINGDFRVFTDMTDKWIREYKDRHSVHDVIESAVRGWFEQALVETVIGIQALKESQEWSRDHVQKALSEEALTAAVMSRYHVNNSVKRELGTKLGKLQPA